MSPSRGAGGRDGDLVERRFMAMARSHHRGDALAHAPHRMDLHGPDRRQDLQHVGAGHLGDGAAADAREDVAFRLSAKFGRGDAGSPLLGTGPGA